MGTDRQHALAAITCRRLVYKARSNTRLWDFCRTVYHLATPRLAALARREQIHLAHRFSDHAPPMSWQLEVVVGATVGEI